MNKLDNGCCDDVCRRPHTSPPHNTVPGPVPGSLESQVPTVSRGPGTSPGTGRWGFIVPAITTSLSFRPSPFLSFRPSPFLSFRPWAGRWWKLFCFILPDLPAQGRNDKVGVGMTNSMVMAGCSSQVFADNFNCRLAVWFGYKIWCGLIHKHLNMAFGHSKAGKYGKYDYHRDGKTGSFDPLAWL